MIKLKKLSTAAGLASLSVLGVLASISQTSFPASANAAQVKQYVPPSNRERLQRTEGGGSRGCTNAAPVSLSLLTPKDHIARTVSAHPTFLWHISDATSAPLVFTLTERGANQPIFQQQLKADRAGIMRLEIPPTAPRLEEGKEYRWTVTLVCNEKRPSENVYARAWIERVATPSNLDQKLAAASSEGDRAAIYAQSGLWYDAVATLDRVRTANPYEKQASNLFVSLLEQVGLNQVATLERQRL
ncbi:MAG TPA: hypothetical protein DCY88_20170 [Cyanobacteria bacterium UBA11372]|nr:hypothetical protein [Cyanobacteria bacterium UBA11372]